LHNILNEHNRAINETWQQADFSHPAEKRRAGISQYCLNGNK